LGRTIRVQIGYPNTAASLDVALSDGMTNSARSASDKGNLAV
jgi:hypothetical protein